MGTCPPQFHPPSVSSLSGLLVSWLWVCDGWSSAIRPFVCLGSTSSSSLAFTLFFSCRCHGANSCDQPASNPCGKPQRAVQRKHTTQLRGNSTLHQFNHRFHIYQVLSGNYLKLLSLIRFYSSRPIQISLHLERDILRVGPLL